MKLATIKEEEDPRVPPRVRRWLGLACVLAVFGMIAAAAPVHILLITMPCGGEECAAIRTATKFFWVLIAWATLGAYVALEPSPVEFVAHAAVVAFTATAVGWATFPAAQESAYRWYFS